MTRRVVVSVAAATALLGVATGVAGQSSALARFGRLPLTFEMNTGHYDKRVQFLARTRGATVFLTSTEMVMVLKGKAGGEVQGARAESSGNLAPSPRLRGEGRGEGLGAFGCAGEGTSPPTPLLGEERGVCLPLPACGERRRVSPSPRLRGEGRGEGPHRVEGPYQGRGRP